MYFVNYVHNKLTNECNHLDHASELDMRLYKYIFKFNSSLKILQMSFVHVKLWSLLTFRSHVVF
jgi:hypothetical protein